MAHSAPDWEALHGAIAGEVVLPGSPEYEAARKPPLAAFRDARPAAVVRCRAPEDVAETIALARRHGLRVAPRSGGHCFAGRSATDGIVIDVGPMGTTAVADGVATVGAGSRLGDLYDALDAHGLTIPAGCGPDVGIAGLTLGGGLGILGRRDGLTSDSLVGARVVLADGRVVDCDEHHDADLFWALRGAGGGQFGVVTSLVFRTLEAPAATRFHLVWPVADAEAVVRAWQAWAPDAPGELAASLLVKAPADPDRPPAVNVFGAMLAGESDTAERLRALVDAVGADPASSQRAHASYRETKRALAAIELAGAGDGEDGVALSRSEYFARPLAREAVAALVSHLGRERAPGEARELDFSPWGGAYTRVPEHATAFAHRDHRFLLKHAAEIGAAAPPAARDAAKAWLERSWTLVHPWGSGRAYPYFPDPELAGWARAYHGANLERLRRVKAAYDPDEVFRFPQSIPPA
jgi:FAD/FMN-containing dehydrogenase